MAVKVVYEGPAGAINHDVAAATGGGSALEADKTYSVPNELAASLVDSGAGWRFADAKKQQAWEAAKAEEQEPPAVEDEPDAAVEEVAVEPVVEEVVTNAD